MSDLLAGRPRGESPLSPPSAQGFWTKFANLVGGKFNRLMVLGAALLVMLIGGVAAAMYVLPNFRQPRPDLVTHVVKREKLLLSIVERGSLESQNNNDIYCRVKARSQNSTVSSTIRWIIDNGTHVKQGQLLVELDDSGLQEQRAQQEIVVSQAEAAWKQAQEAYGIQEIQNNTDLKEAELEVKLATIDLEKYTKGDYEQTKADIDGKRIIALSDLQMLRDRSAWAERMMKKGYYSQTQSLAEQSRLEGAQIALQKIDEEARVLKYNKERSETDYGNKVILAELKVKRVKKQAEAKLNQLRDDRDSKQKVFEKEDRRLDEILGEIVKCQIRAPQPGMVVYYLAEQSRFGSGSQQSIVAQGEPVR